MLTLQVELSVSTKQAETIRKLWEKSKHGKEEIVIDDSDGYLVSMGVLSRHGHTELYMFTTLGSRLAETLVFYSK